MTKEYATTYLRCSGFSDEQIKAIEGAFTCDKCVYSTSEGCQYDDITETIPPFEDCISRKAVLDGIDAYIEKAQSTGSKDDFISFEELVVKELPSVNPQKPKSEWEHDHEILKAYSDGANYVLDHVRAEIDAARFLDKDKKLFKNANASGLEVAMDIIDKYKAEGGKE